jgi:hypothetical protein
MPPQPSATWPHRALNRWQVVGLHCSPSSLQLAGPMPMHTLRWLHEPQLSTPPQPSGIDPQ